MKIVSLKAENVKRLSAVEIKPDGNLVEITGANGQGKTSVLDSIWYALGGQGVIAKSPIRKGEEEARIKIDMGELVVTRTFRHVEKPAPGEKDFTTKITVADAEGGEKRSPQAILDGLMGSLCFDPLAFTRMQPKDQFNELRKFLPDVDFEKIEGLQRADYTARTDVNRERDRARAAAELVDFPGDTPDETVDEAALVQQMADAAKHNGDIETRKANRVTAAERIQTMKAQADDLATQRDQVHSQALDEVERIRQETEKRIAEVQERAKAQSGDLHSRQEQLEKTAAELQARLDSAEALPEPIDTAKVQSDYERAKVINANVAKKLQKVELVKQATTCDEQSKAITARMAAREDAKREAIAKAQLPVAGLGFGDGIILFNGVPFEQASDAERLRVSCAIAMASNPKLRVIRVRDGSLLDGNAMKLLAQMADERDYQVWVETVDSRGRAAVVLEDGHVQAETVVAEAAE